MGEKLKGAREDEEVGKRSGEELKQARDDEVDGSSTEYR